MELALLMRAVSCCLREPYRTLSSWKFRRAALFNLKRSFQPCWASSCSFFHTRDAPSPIPSQIYRERRETWSINRILTKRMVVLNRSDEPVQYKSQIRRDFLYSTAYVHDYDHIRQLSYLPWNRGTEDSSNPYCMLPEKWGKVYFHPNLGELGMKLINLD